MLSTISPQRGVSRNPSHNATMNVQKTSRAGVSQRQRSSIEAHITRMREGSAILRQPIERSVNCLSPAAASPVHQVHSRLFDATSLTDTSHNQIAAKVFLETKASWKIGHRYTNATVCRRLCSDEQLH
jgi:hypothetical protein